MCEARVVTTAHSTQMTFFPVLSTRSPNIGDIGADMTYTTLPREYKRYLMTSITTTKKKKKKSKKFAKPSGKQTLAHLV